jgi:hypothetical protein
MDIRRPWRAVRRAVVLTLALTVAHGAVAPTAPTAATAATAARAAQRDSTNVFHVAPDGNPSNDGATWWTAGTIASIPRFVRAAEPGDEIWVRGDAGAYHTSEIVTINAGGSAGAPVVIRGVDHEGTMRARPELVGTRSSPWVPGRSNGREVFRLLEGADHLRFENLGFRNQGNGAFRIGSDITDLEIVNVRATNVRRFLESYPSGQRTSAAVDGLRIRNVVVDGYSKGAIRLRDDTRDVVMRDVIGDSRRQDGDRFAIGITLLDTVHDVLMDRVTMRNSYDTRNRYWNGDGFATERGTYDIRFRDTVASGNTDAGYDVKGHATFVRPIARDNKRNFRFWGDSTVYACVGRRPNKRGGTGTQAQVWAGTGAQVRLVGCSLRDTDPATIVLDLDDAARVTAQDVAVDHASSGRLRDVDDRARLRRYALLRTACPAATTPAAGFADAAGNHHRAAIDCIVHRDIGRGRSQRSFGPGQQVTRGQLATFLRNTIRATGGRLRGTGDPVHFTDIDGSVHARSIQQLSAVGLVDGYEDGTYRPADAVTRAQLATFLVRVAEHISDLPASCGGPDVFRDDNGSTHEASINGAALAGLTTGTSGGHYAPRREVTRAQMAQFLARLLGLMVVEGATLTSTATDDVAGDGAADTG